jgi:hypothetical protein
MTNANTHVLPRPRPFLETLLETLSSFLAHFWLF